MKIFVVHSDLPCDVSGAIRWMEDVPRKLTDQGIKEVRINTAYCCVPDKKVIAELEGPDKETVRRALLAVGMPVTDVMEAIKVGASQAGI